MPHILGCFWKRPFHLSIQTLRVVGLLFLFYFIFGGCGRLLWAHLSFFSLLALGFALHDPARRHAHLTSSRLLHLVPILQRILH
ncbi:hypothetical protein BJ165DRAFT_1514155 [Panaeolus papilionaceus]|nr:hypothetical protein BJ165DRAFT_1514155 [Panaeolus papilionaceus]